MSDELPDVLRDVLSVGEMNGLPAIGLDGSGGLGIPCAHEWDAGAGTTVICTKCHTERPFDA